MKRPTMMMVAAVATLGTAAAARAQAPETAPAPAPVPPTIPNNSDPVSPEEPVVPGTVPSMATPEALPPPAPMPVTPAPVATPYEVEGVPRGYPVWISKMGSAVMLGGGFEDFTQSAPKSQTNGGGSWDLRLAAGTRQFVGLEAAYVGAARSVNALGFNTNTTLVSNGVEGLFRLNVPVAAGPLLLEPFGFVGLGWQHYYLSKSVTTADVTRSDDVMSMPYGAGFMMAYGMFMLDARVQWRETYYNDMFRAEGSKLNTWGAGGNIGVEF
ncbi:MAG TPA: hypothetical protein VHL80_09910 [Polyangia bacterium]|nr:hypothetical protein [Polyangia bacterium]